MTIHKQGAELSSQDLLELWRQAPDYVPPPPPPVSWEAFHDWLDEDTHAEWVDGEIIEMPPSNAEHLDNSGFLFTFLLLYIQRHRLGRIFHEGLLMRLRQRPSGRQPDLLFVRTENVDRIKWTYLDGPADLAVEIVSPDSVTRDYQEKLAEYQTAGIPEYWVVDPLQQVARFYELGVDGRYQLGAVDEDGVYTSKVVTGFRLRVSWLWQRPLPTIEEALADLPK
jgi:Uma2 family endonuclease